MFLNLVTNYEVFLIIIIFIWFYKLNLPNFLVTAKLNELEPMNYIKSDKLHYCWIHIPKIMKNIKTMYKNNYDDYIKNKLINMKVGTDSISKVHLIMYLHAL